MAFKFTFTFIGLQLLASKWAEALNCYSCADVGSGPCFDPANRNAKVVTCSAATADFSKLLGKTISENVLNIATKATRGYLCFKVRFMDNLTNPEEVLRGCVPAAQDISTFCKAMSKTGKNSGNNTRKCSFCSSSLCNSGTTPVVGFISVFLSLLMTLTLF